MKKLLALLLAAMMLLALVPAALAEGAEARSEETEKLEGGEMPAVESAPVVVKAPIADGEKSLFTCFNAPGTYIELQSANGTHGWTEHNNPNLPGDGDYLQSGNTGVNSSNARLETYNFYMHEGETLSFQYFYDTEQNYDKFIFEVNGVEEFNWSGSSEGWQWYTWTAPSNGMYWFKWIYRKDSSTHVGQDCVKLANLTYSKHEFENIERSSIKAGCGTVGLIENGSSSQSNVHPFMAHPTSSTPHIYSTNYHIPNSSSKIRYLFCLPEGYWGTYKFAFDYALNAESYDKFYLFHNGDQIYVQNGNVSGGYTWQHYEFELSNYTNDVIQHEIIFEYRKDGSVDNFEDKLAIKNIHLTQSDVSRDRFYALDAINASNTQSRLIFSTPKGQNGFDMVGNINGAGIVASNNYNVHSSTAYMETSVNMAAGEKLEFTYGVTSQSLDVFRFRANNEVMLEVSGWSSAEVNNNILPSYTFTAPSTRNYSFRWEYVKDANTSWGGDRVSIFNVKYTGTRNNTFDLDDALNVSGGNLHFQTPVGDPFERFGAIDYPNNRCAVSCNRYYEETQSSFYTYLSNIRIGDKLRFEYRVSSESYDKLKFSLIGSDNSEIHSMNCTNDGMLHTYEYIFTQNLSQVGASWFFEKDATVNSNEDRAYIYFVELVRVPTPSLDDALNTSDTQQRLHFNTYNPYPFEVEYNGYYYATSTNAGVHSSESFMTADTVMLTANSKIEFDYFITSEANYDLFEFYVNGTKVHSNSGNAGNQHYTYTVPSRDGYTFHWKYKKDGSQSAGIDAVQIRNVKITLGTLSLDLINSDDTQQELHFTTGGSYPFECRVSGSDSYYATSTNMNANNTTSYMQATASLAANTELEFYYYLSSEQNYDLFRFYVNGQQVFSDSGDIGIRIYRWTAPSAGSYTFRWEYIKDGSTSNGDDCLEIMAVKLSAGGSIAIPGDTDGNGIVNMVDAILALRHAMGITPLTSDQMPRADIDGNGSVNMSDAVMILRKSMGIIS